MNEGFLLIAAWGESELGLEAVSLDEQKMELTGSAFAYQVVRAFGFLHLSFHSLDRVESPILLLTVGDQVAGWRILCRSLRQMESAKDQPDEDPCPR